jgi:CRP-like cAMP-binding protein
MRLIDTICLLSSLSEASIAELKKLVVEKELPKGHRLLNLWQIDRYLHFIVKGAGRVYYLKDGQDISDYFAMDGQFLGGLESLFTQQPSHKAMELLEDSTIETILYADLEKLCFQHHDIP